MRLENVTAAIRPRSDWEAVDLGFAMVRRDFWRCITAWCLAVALPTVLGVWLLWDHPLLLLCLFWWWRPAGSRLVLFELSRRLFGEAPRWGDVWREIPRAWTRRFFHRFLLLRFSPWLPVTLAVESLEGLRGNDYKQRARQISRRGEGVAVGIYLVGDVIAVWLGVGLVFLILMFIPEGQDGAWQEALMAFDPENPQEIPLLILRVMVFCVMAAMALCDVFLTGAGFGIYINNRTWLEGWDVELAFRRMSRRLTHTALVLAAGLAVFSAATPLAIAQEDDPAERIRQVKEAPEFEVHTITDRVPVPKGDWLDWLSFSGGGALQGGLTILGYGLLVAGLVWLAWMIWRNRHIFVLRRGEGSGAGEKTRARVVMGMEVTRESLPHDVPGTALQLWENGRHHEAMVLLYRGAISALVNQHHVDIDESDTEGDCLRRVDGISAGGDREFFGKLTDVWSAHAYARRQPDDETVRGLCASWPFLTEGRPA